MTTAPASPPVVSVIMANYCGAAYLEAAMRAVLAQTERRLELIVADDASDDPSVSIARAVAADDRRVRVIAGARNRGPGATRNLALDAARGDWIAVVDSDDLIHPERLIRLIAAAEAAGADLVADDLVYFGNPAEQGRTLLQPLALTAPMTLAAARYLRANGGDPAVPAFGYLKPVIRRTLLGGRRYDAQLRIGEDYDLVLRLLIEGARFLLLPDPLYAYRRHPGSVSHRLSVDTVQAMLAAHRNLPDIDDPVTRAAAAAVDLQLCRALRYERLVADIKARRWTQALPRLADPAMIARLAESLRDRRRRKAARSNDAGDPAPLGLLPELPSPGQAWDRAPASLAGRIVATGALPSNAPDWAVWLAQATAEVSPG